MRQAPAALAALCALLALTDPAPADQLRNAPTDLDLSANQLRRAATNIADTLDTAVRFFTDRSPQTHSNPLSAHRSSPTVHPRRQYKIPIDATLLAPGTDTSHEFTLRLLHHGFTRAGYEMTRADAKRAYRLVPWHMHTPDKTVRTRIRRALHRGQTTLLYQSNGVAHAIAAWERQALRMRRAAADIRRRLRDTRYAENAIASFYIAHVNAPHRHRQRQRRPRPHVKGRPK